MALATQVDPNSFYSDEIRVDRCVVDGFTYSNTDAGVLYGKIAVSGGTATVSLYANDKRQSGSLVAQGSASVSSTDYTGVELTAQNASGLTASIWFDFTSDATAGNFRVIATFTFDKDLELHAKTLSNLLTSGNKWEGEGTSGCGFVRAHRDATRWAINWMREELIYRLDCDDANMPNLFEVWEFQPIKKACAFYALALIYRNKAQNKDPRVGDPDALSADKFEADANMMIRSARLYIDRDEDGEVDGRASGRTSKWR